MVAPYPSAAAPSAPPPHRSWLSRYWGCLLPIGCFGIIFAFGAFFLSLFGVVSISMRSSDVYREAVVRASTHPAVLTELGAPIEPGFFASGSIQVSGSGGTADISIPISGPKNQGTVYAVANKSAGTWTFSRLEVEVHGRPARIPLLPSPASP